MRTKDDDEAGTRMDTPKVISDDSPTASAALPTSAIRLPSPLPWRVAGAFSNYIDNASGVSVAEAFDQVDAALIVTAVNAHEALVASLRKFFEDWPAVEKAIGGMFALQFARTSTQYTGPTITDALDQMRAALLKAEAK